MKKKFFTTVVVRPWPGVPREAGDAPTLAAFRARLARAVSDLR